MQLDRIVTPNLLNNSFLNLHISKFKRSNIGPLELSFKKCKSLDWLSEFYFTLLFVSDIGAHSFAHLIRIKINNLKTEE